MKEQTIELQNICTKIANELHILKYDIYGIAKEDSSASSKELKPFALSTSQKKSLTLRVWNKQNQIGIASTSNLTESGLKRAFQIAYDSSQFVKNDSENDFSSLCNEKLNRYEEKKLDELNSIKDLTNAAIKAEDTILKSNSAFKTVPYNKVNQSHLSRFYFNSNGVFRYQDISSAYCYFYPLAEQENKIPRQLGHLAVADCFQNLDWSECAKSAVEKTSKHLNYQKVKSGNYTVIFAPEAFLSLVNAFSNFFNAQNILDKKSLSTEGTLNTQISTSLLNIMDSPFHERNVSPIYFDEEGSPTKDLSIIENGILKSFIHTSYTARKMNTTPTGHTNLGAKLTASPYFLRIFASNNQTQQEPLIKDKTVIYVEDVKALHAGINALQGSFSLPFDGFIVENNERTSIESATVAGDFLTLLKQIIYVSNREEVTPSGICPEIWVENLSITGS